MERAGGKDRGALSQWRGRKIIAEMVKAKVMELQVVDVALLTSWMERNNQSKTKTRTASDLYQPDHPTSLHPDHYCH